MRTALLRRGRSLWNCPTVDRDTNRPVPIPDTVRALLATIEVS